MSENTGERVDCLHALHGWAILAARDASTDKERAGYVAQAEAFEHAIVAVEDGWDPFDKQAREDYVDVSEAVIRADRNKESEDETPPTVGMQ